MTRTIFAYASFFNFSVFSVVSLLGFYSFKIKSLPRVRLVVFLPFSEEFPLSLRKDSPCSRNARVLIRLIT